MREHATHIVGKLRAEGFQAYFAGGCVRDMLLGVPPADYDVATDATPAQVMRVFPETYAVGAHAIRRDAAKWLFTEAYGHNVKTKSPKKNRRVL